ncbi:plasmid pRiA4b ORF-3 family protein [Oscillatoria sp. CS-180]|uniref:plasmid pRiA4b ORF-3 family protein n=1 Tax=Oscillatoria sp. CS-180 TaxID=3021720 RepID=UPI002330AB38|nr:plasmid pRiA4b ORF-3 family protein [Oscillatoria sp. CS-180]MDB9524408.1 plasmid pRiA4b ORF-3 family protein [Oscillatoria sp. CS-180]
MAPTSDIAQFHIGLLDSDPLIWRRFQIHQQASLNDLHFVIQVVMGWENSHLHAFDIGGDRYADPFPVPLEDTLDSTAITLAELRLKQGTKFIYTYDFGDGWMHQLTAEAITQSAVKPPVCLAGERACPPEDCGGIWGYEELLERLADPEEPEYEDLLDWVGADFDPEVFSVDAVNRQLQGQR